MRYQKAVTDRGIIKWLTVERHITACLGLVDAALTQSDKVTRCLIGRFCLTCQTTCVAFWIMLNSLPILGITKRYKSRL